MDNSNFEKCSDKRSGKGWPRESRIVECVLNRFWGLDHAQQSHMVMWALKDRKLFEKCYPGVLDA